MGSKLREEAERFLGSLGHRMEPDRGRLKGLLNDAEFAAVERVIEEFGNKFIQGLIGGTKNKIACLQMFIGLEFDTVSGQVRQFVLEEMGRREGGVWDTKGRPNTLNQTELARLTQLSKSQVNKFMHRGGDDVVTTTTLDRLANVVRHANVVRLRVASRAGEGTVYKALPSHPPRVRGGQELPEDQPVSQQVRRILKDQMSSRGWSQQEVADWTGVGQSQICRFLRGEPLKTTALDRLGAFFWVKLERIEDA